MFWRDSTNNSLGKSLRTGKRTGEEKYLNTWQCVILYLINPERRFSYFIIRYNKQDNYETQLHAPDTLLDLCNVSMNFIYLTWITYERNFLQYQYKSIDTQKLCSASLGIGEPLTDDKASSSTKYCIKKLPLHCYALSRITTMLIDLYVVYSSTHIYGPHEWFHVSCLRYIELCSSVCLYRKDV